MTKVTSYLTFNGNCKEAMEFYAKCLDATTDFMYMKDNPGADQMPAEQRNGIMHSALMLGETTLLFASDMMGPDPLTRGNGMCVCFHGDLDVVTKAFEKLSDGANVTRPLKTEFFGTYGDLVDKFGIMWMFQSDATK